MIRRWIKHLWSNCHVVENSQNVNTPPNSANQYILQTPTHVTFLADFLLGLVLHDLQEA